jgi:hypothetical protein
LAHGVGAGEDHPVVAFELTQRRLQRTGICRRPDLDGGELDHLGAQSAQFLGQLGGLLARAGHHNALSEKPPHGR